MGKKRSVVFFVLITLVLAALCVWCTVSFPAGIETYNSVFSVVKKDPSLGGSHTGTYYPDGVISAVEYETNVNSYGAGAESAKQEYEEKYSVYGTGAIYLEKEKALNADGSVKESFQSDFLATVNAVRERYEASAIEGAKVEVVNDYTIRVTAPSSLESVTGTNGLFSTFSYTGEVTVKNGDTVLVENSDEMKVVDYVSGVTTQTADEVTYVVVNFTPAGRALIKSETASASSSATVTLNFNVGENTVINLSVDQTIDLASLYISGGGFTAETASYVAVLLNNAIHGTQTDLVLDYEDVDVQSLENVNGENTMLFIYIGLGAFALAAVVFFFVKYRWLGLANLYGYLTYAVAMVLCLAFIPLVTWGVGGVAAIIATTILLFVSNLVCFESARKIRYDGKAMTSAVKTGYKNVLWKLFDLHFVLAIASALVFAIAVSELQAFAFIFLLGVAFSGVCSLGLTRFYWAITMAFVDGEVKKDKFCNFKKKAKGVAAIAPVANETNAEVAE